MFKTCTQTDTRLLACPSTKPFYPSLSYIISSASLSAKLLSHAIMYIITPHPPWSPHPSTSTFTLIYSSLLFSSFLLTCHMPFHNFFTWQTFFTPFLTLHNSYLSFLIPSIFSLQTSFSNYSFALLLPHQQFTTIH